MINLILTNSLDNTCILQAIKADYKQGNKQMALVPDRFTLSYEKSILSALNLVGTFDIEVASFSRLANKNLLDKTNLIDTQTEVMLLRKVIEDNKSSLVSLKNSCNSVGFASELGAAISQIRGSGISAEELIATADTLKGNIAGKTRDIALIYSKYVAALQSGMCDGTSKLQSLASNICEMGLENYNLYITEFLSLSKLELNVCRELMKACKNITICIVSGSGDNSHIFPSHMIAKLRAIAKEIDLPIKTTYYSEKLPCELDALSKHLFGYTAPKEKICGDIVQLRLASSINEELKNTALQIIDNVKSGMRYKDIAVVCTDKDKYFLPIASTFEKYNIPCYVDKKERLSSQAVTQFLFAYLKVVSSRFRKSDVFELSKQVLIDCDYKSVCVFENYCLKYGVDYTRFASEFALGKEEEKNIAELVRVEILKIVGHDGMSFPSKANVATYLKIIFKMLEKNEIKQRVSSYSESLILSGDETAASIAVQAYDKLFAILEQYNAMLGTSVMPVDEFVNILSASAQAVEISAVPMYLDSVFVGETSQSRFENIKAMYIVGASEGAFPLQHSDVGIVGEKENAAWSKSGIIIEPNAKQMNYTEKLKLIMLLLKPSERLSISCPVGEGGQILSQSVNYIAEITNKLPQKYPQPNESWSESDFINYYSGTKLALVNLLELRGRLASRLLAPTTAALTVVDGLYSLACQSHGKGYVDALISSGGGESVLSQGNTAFLREGKISPSQLEKYFNCPFKHYVDYILRAQRREKADLEINDIGTILHAAAQLYFEKEDSCDVSEDEVRRRINDIYVQLEESNEKLKVILNRAGGRRTLDELRANSIKMLVILVKKMQVTAFRPDKNMLELKFGFGGESDFPAIELNVAGKTILLRGVIDRVDRQGNKFMIIDYKSKAAIDFSPSNIMCGERCQMFVYLNAFAKSDMKIGGVFYMLMSDKMKKEEEKENLYMYNGYAAADLNNMTEFDNTLTTAEKCESKLYPIKVKVTKKDTTIDDKQILTNEDMLRVASYTKKLCEKAAGEIALGYVKPSPVVFEKKENANCKYCEYKSMCGVEKSDDNIRVIKNIETRELRAIVAKACEKTDVNKNIEEGK